ncbi:lipopolysaccharide-induced tumor necrosis factor-alpha factor homolog [Nelusetta ayraudi]|uniref:lipopolysaccharide-induced tumor necrosis factor-alpha factor homolog n=1 Tax=Nelusetta ayraudi TaxID=303726 RepID=UPI003F713D33
MQKGNVPLDSAPPYPGPPMNYAGPPPQPQPGMYPPQAQPGMYPPQAQPGMYPPQPGPYPPPPVYQGAVAVQAVPVSTVTHVVVSHVLGERPGQTSCPHCRQTVITRIDYSAGLLTWLICGAMAMFGFFLCCCIPFCIDACKDVEHRCPNCHNLIYIYKRM